MTPNPYAEKAKRDGAALYLRRVRSAAKRRMREDAALRKCIVTAYQHGASLRAIADAAGVSHPTIHEIVREVKDA
jgi:AcrR family transcriptional regulator